MFISSGFIMIVSLTCVYDVLKLCITSYVVVRFLKFLFIIYKSVIMHYVWPQMDISDLQEMWTVVTGCTDGIGRAYVEELAKSRGMRKFFLIGRNAVKLAVVRKEMEERYAAQIRIHVFDLEKDDLDTLREVLEGLEVGILVNCAGIGPPLVANFMELPEGLPSKILRVNIVATVKLIEITMPGMIRRNKGIIVNVSSITCWRPLPYMSAYPASKAAMSFFSEALHDEFKHTNVHVQCLMPLLVLTKIASYSPDDEPSIFVISAKDYAKEAVRLLGNWSLATGCVKHDIEVAFSTLIGFWVFKKLFVPLGLLGVHRKRVAEYAKRMKLDGD
uniref:Uncharacterized protein n=1 Tax=Parascaris univalens TaxID=6257 RepID=A0A915AG81_PARUN